jgi:fatty acid amide hydrolase
MSVGTPLAGSSTAVTGLSATEIATRIASGDLSSSEVVEAHIARIEEVDGRLNAVVSRRFTHARAEAKEVDAKRARGETLGPLGGVPITLKDQFHVAGLPTTYGLPSRSNDIASADGPLVGRLRDAGAIILGKTNVAQLLFYQEGDNPLYGRTANPWNLDRTSGGGSGGEAAIIAAGGSPLGMGSDVGGSIRTPAHFCGIHGFRPTSRRLTIRDSPAELFFPGFNEIALDAGPMARHVEDLSLAMRILAAPGQDRFDPKVPPVPWREPSEVDITGLRIAMYDDDGYWPAAPALRRAVHEAADALRDRGAHVEPFTPPSPGANATRFYFSFLMSDGLDWAKPHLRGNPVDKRIKTAMQIAAIPNLLRPVVGGLMKAVGQRRLGNTIAMTRRRSAGEFWRVADERDWWRDQFIAALDACGFEAILCPAHCVPAMRHGATNMLFDAISVLNTFNVLGMPAGAVAATKVRPGEESDRRRTFDIVERTARKTEQGSVGLPVGVQVAARLWRDDIVLAVMAALEEHFRKQPDYPEGPPC